MPTDQDKRLQHQQNLLKITDTAFGRTALEHWCITIKCCGLTGQLINFTLIFCIDLGGHIAAIIQFYHTTSENKHCYFVTFAISVLWISLFCSLIPGVYFGFVPATEVIDTEKERLFKNWDEKTGSSNNSDLELNRVYPMAKQIVGERVHYKKHLCIDPLKRPWTARLKALSIFLMGVPYVLVPLALGGYLTILESIWSNDNSASVWGAKSAARDSDELLGKLHGMIASLSVILASKTYVLFYGHWVYIYKKNTEKDMRVTAIDNFGTPQRV